MFCKHDQSSAYKGPKTGSLEQVHLESKCVLCSLSCGTMSVVND